MCGIFGFVAWERPLPPVDDLCKATNLLRHRGPDGGAYWQEPGVFLGHRRLAIIDLSPAGTQPMASADGRYVITFNGEIYNYPELRDELRGLGTTFLTSTDTEVILAGYVAWGTAVVERLEGMFAFGLYDRFDRTLLLARDRFGEKPLLMTDRDDRVVFASELAPLVAVGAGERAIDLDALGGYLCLNYVPGNRTMLQGVERLRPAEWRLYGQDGLRSTSRYWFPPCRPRAAARRHTAELLDELQAHLDDAVRCTLRSDVPVGLFLSGGVDSSLVAESAARVGRLEQAFCVDFSTQGFSEWNAAVRVANRIGVDLVRVPLDASVLNEFLDVTAHLDDPLADSSAMAVWTISRAASAHLKVVLGGDGGDELFGGYLTYAASRWHRALKRLLPDVARSALARVVARMGVNDREKVSFSYKLHRFLRAMTLDTREAHFTWNGTWLPAEAAHLAADPRLQEAARTALYGLAASATDGDVTLHDLQLLDIREYLANDILTKVDRATMAHGLESRAPLLNKAVAEFALGLPEECRVRGNTTKVILRDLCARHFGREHADAPKQGFSIPVHTWLRHDGRVLMTTLLDRERIGQLASIDSAVVAQAVDEHLACKRSYGWELWGLMVLVAWYEQRVANPPNLRRLPDATDLRPIAFNSSMQLHTDA
jgi:asparagine synthase (glutamine-hydrolysing)